MAVCSVPQLGFKSQTPLLVYKFSQPHFSGSLNTAASYMLSLLSETASLKVQATGQSQAS